MRRASARVTALTLFFAALGCRHAAPVDTSTVTIPAGAFFGGSSLDERAHALSDAHEIDPHAGDGTAWVRGETARRAFDQGAFEIMQVPVTHLDYWRFVVDTDAPEPWIDEASWAAQDTGYSYAIVERVAWGKGHPPLERRDHPVVLVSHDDARAYCAWWGGRLDGRGDLPSELEWEKAARGTDGRAYPWGDTFHPRRANTVESNQGDTVAVASYPGSVSPFGVHDMAGNVFEWTRTPVGERRFVVKGGGWNAPAMFARAAARHDRAAQTRHVALGFRCVLRR